jgi:molecular chaperone DnaK (HSP70)
VGNSYSSVSIFRNGKVELIPNEFGNVLTPSYVTFTDKEILVGGEVKSFAYLDPKRTIYAINELGGIYNVNNRT